MQNIQFVKDVLANNRFIEFTICGRLLIHNVTWRMCSRLRILTALGLMGIGPGSTQAAGVRSAFPVGGLRSGDPSVVVVETVSEPTRWVAPWLLRPFSHLS